MVVDEFTRLQRERVYDEELEGAQDYMVGHFPLTIEVPDAIATQVLNQLFYELPVDELPRYRERVLRVTPDEIQRVARWFIRPAQLSVVLVGDADKFVERSEGRRLRQLRAHSDRAGRSAVGRLLKRAGNQQTASDPPHAVVRRGVRRSVRRRAGRRAARAASRTSTCSASAASGFAAAGGRLIADFHGLVGHRPHRGAPRHSAVVRDACASWSAAREAREAARARRHRLSRFQLPADAAHQAARHPGDLLRQPAALGLAARPHQDDEARSSIACCRSFRSRKRSISARRHRRALRRPSADRSRAAAADARAFLRKLNLDPSKPVVALLPGSRANELERLAPVIAQAVPAIAAAGAGRAVRGRARAESARRPVRAVRHFAA